MRFFILPATIALGLSPFAVMAQTPGVPGAPGNQADMVAMMQRAAHNQLGVLEYCQAQGSVGADTVSLQQRVLGMLPPAKVDGLDDAEAAGKKGVVSFAGNQVPLADAAKAQNTTPDAMCKQMATMLQAQAAQLPK
jgi:hypothetical protein